MPLPTTRFRIRVQEWRYWHVRRPSERALIWVARHLPRELRSRVYISVGVEALSKMPSHTVVPEVGMLEALEAFHGARRG